MAAKTKFNFRNRTMNHETDKWLKEMQGPIALWLIRGMESEDSSVANIAAVVSGKLVGHLGEHEESVKSLALQTVGRLSQEIHPSDWRSKRAAWQTCCEVVNGVDSIYALDGGSDIYDGLNPADHGTDRPERGWQPRP
jgi:hypothetical protein